MSGALPNRKHELFAQGLAKGLTQGAAYKAAGYGGGEASACRLAKDGKVRARVDEIIAKGAERAEITVERVLRELALIGFANMADYMRVGGDGDPYLDFSALTRDQAAALAEVTVEDYKEGRGEDARDVRKVRFKLADKKGALVDIGRHLKMFTDKVEHGGAVTHVHESPEEARANIARFIEGKRQGLIGDTRH